MLISEAFELYRLDVIEYHNRSLKKTEIHNIACRNLTQFVGDIELSDITRMHVRAWKRHLDIEKSTGKKRSVGTVREYLTQLRMVLKYAHEEGYPCISYTQVELPRKEDPKPEFLTPDQVQELIEVTFDSVRGYSTLNRYRNRAIIALFFCCGIRASELMRLNRDSIRSDNSFVVRGKLDRTRPCKLDAITARYIREYLALRDDSNNALFVTKSGTRISKHTLKDIFDNAQEKVTFNIPLHPHILRHSFATDLMRSGAPIRIVQEMLGHRSLATTQIYTHVVNHDLDVAHMRWHTRLAAVGEPLGV